MDKSGDNLGILEILEAKKAQRAKILSELQSFLKAYSSIRAHTTIEHTASAANSEATEQKLHSNTETRPLEVQEALETIKYLKALKALGHSEYLEVQRVLDARKRTFLKKRDSFRNIEDFMVIKLQHTLRNREALEAQIAYEELKVLESEIRSQSNSHSNGDIPVDDHHDLEAQKTLKIQEISIADKALVVRETLDIQEISRAQKILETSRTTEQSQEYLKTLKKRYPNINFDTTIISVPKFDGNGEVVHDEQGRIVFIHKKLHELTDEYKDLIRNMNGFDFFFHGLGGGGEFLKQQTTTVYTTRPACPSFKQNPIISLDWHRSNLPDVASCEKAAKDLVGYLTDEIRLKNFGNSRLIGFSMGNLSLKAFADEALANDYDLSSTHVFYQQIPVLHPKRLVFTEEQLKKIGCVGIDSMIDFRFKDRPFKMGADIFHLISYTKTFMKEQAKRMGYAKDAIARISGKEMAKYINDENTEDYSLKTIMDRFSTPPASFVEKEESRQAEVKTNPLPDR